MKNRIRIPGTNAFAYADMNEAKSAFLERTGENSTDSDEVSLNIYQTPSGRNFYEVGYSGNGTDCLWESLVSADDWFWLNWRQYIEEPVKDEYGDYYVTSFADVDPLNEEEAWQYGGDQLSAERIFREKNPQLFLEG